jgi:uncharacterized DUF497 family protein
MGRTVVVGDFEWDVDKARTNLAKHGVGFDDAVRAFLDPLAIDLADESHEDRWILIGLTLPERLLYVVYTERVATGRTRIISARKATRHEKKAYEEQR